MSLPDANAKAGGPAEPDPRRWWALALICGLQFMLLLDVTVVNVALPRIQESLGFTRSGLAWVVDGYVLMSGGLLLLGGRLADFFGRRRLLLTGVVVFAVSSAVSGAAVSPGMLVAGRFGQGLAEALAAPASLGLIALLFTEPAERTKALGIWGGLAALGGTSGSVISGVLTDLASWRWIFYINLPVAVLVLVCVPRLVSESRMAREEGESLDVVGASVSTAGLVSLVFGLLQAAEHAWTSPSVVVPVAAGACLLLVMLAVENRVRDPLVPLGFFANRTRSVINAVSLLFMAAFISYTFMMTLFAQQVLGHSPLRNGLSWLPLGLAIGAGIALGTALTPRLGVRLVAAAGFAGAGGGLLLTGMIDTGTSYPTGVLPGMVVFGLFAGVTMPASTTAALHGVTAQDSGLASGVQTTMQQIGSALGLAVLVTLALRHAETGLRGGLSPDAALTSGYALSFRIGAALMLTGAILILALFERVSPVLRDPTAELTATTR